ncbi:hypothetical protein D1007_43216 [Hordeum vulgare]|nr:hypothetical protein D1007_43216 [Hordeum vulgare]
MTHEFDLASELGAISAEMESDPEMLVNALNSTCMDFCEHVVVLDDLKEYDVPAQVAEFVRGDFPMPY